MQFVGFLCIVVWAAVPTAILFSMLRLIDYYVERRFGFTLFVEKGLFFFFFNYHRLKASFIKLLDTVNSLPSSQVRRVRSWVGVLASRSQRKQSHL